MKKIILLFCLIGVFIISCEPSSNEIIPQQEVAEIDMSDFNVYTNNENLSAKSSANTKIEKCASMKVLNLQLKENPGLYKKMYNIELHTRKAIAAKKPNNPGGGNGGGGTNPDPEPTIYSGAITIPVVVNIIETTAGNVTQAQIDSQIAILNEDFKNGNPNTGNTPIEFTGLIADVDITFELVDTNRKTSRKTSWGTRDTMKKSKRGGINPTDPEHNLNIWVCEIGGGILGYAQFPGGSTATDGIVITSSAFGETTGVYGDGRTATHEVGHWLNLRHIWGDGGCGVDDYVADTPVAGNPNYGSNGDCPGVVNSCNEGTGDLPDMTMNYMDYVYDNCMYMFTKGQNDRMRTIFGNGGSRESFVQ